MSKPYAELGRTLAEAREQSSLDQAELAALLGCKQQSISRWETGASRPRATEIARVAAALGLDADRLMELAGYDSSALPTISFAQPFPFENLDPETFERSVEYLLAKIYRDAAVTLAGSPGHTQDGLDIVVRLNDGTRHSFQCKRVARFGPAEVEKAIAAHTAQADKKHLVLSRVASPQAAEALYEHKGWDLWDKHVLSRKIRQELTEDDQNRFVDIFFHGRRRELLGRAEPGPWLTTKEFFEPFERPNSIFSHQWTLQGRETDIDKLLDALRPDGAPVVLVTGAGGIGKSRLLKEALARLGCTQPDVTVRFLSPSAEISRANPDTLGRGAKLLVVDDAHDRDGLSALFQYAAVERNNARILLASRPYAQSRILQEAALYGIGGMPTVSLERLNAEQMQLLVRDVLLVHGGLAEWAEPIASAVRDSPLVAVMAARVIARDGIAPEMARSNDELRNVVLGKFRKV
ncbi:MAG: helix-turn-helix domain-containing protein, partial [Alphaproteobacteria bacterium]|nr:helix-turn-helix domain-containing protein [Alphaproteobacteria bacterium]